MSIHTKNISRNVDNCFYSCGEFSKYFILQKYLPSGIIDESFGTNGIVQTEVSNKKVNVCNIILETNNIYIIGDNNNDLIIVKYNYNGTLDPTYGINGINTITITNNIIFCVCYDCILHDNSIYIVGNLKQYGVTYFCVTKINADGNIDYSFGDGGIIKSNFSKNGKSNFNKLNGISILNNGKIIVTGSGNCELLPNGEIADDHTNLHYNNQGNESLIVIRYNSDGSLDNTFGLRNGYTIIRTDPNNITCEWCEGPHVISNNGNIIQIGTRNSDRALILSKYTPEGVLDNTFGSNNNGIATLEFIGKNNQSYSHRVDIDNSDNIILYGTRNRKGTSSTEFTKHDIVLVKYTSNGLLDQKFGVNHPLINDADINVDDTITYTYQQQTKGIITYDVSNNSDDGSIDLIQDFNNNYNQYIIMVSYNTFNYKFISFTIDGNIQSEILNETNNNIVYSPELNITGLETYYNSGIYVKELNNINAISINSLIYDSSNVRLFIQENNNNNYENIDLNSYSLLNYLYYTTNEYKLYGSNNINFNNKEYHSINNNFVYLNNDISNTYIINFTSSKNIILKLVVIEPSTTTNLINIDIINDDTLVIPSNSIDANNILNDVGDSFNVIKNTKIKQSVKNRILTKKIFKYFKLNNDILDLKYKFNTYLIIKNSEKYNLTNLKIDEAIYAVFNNNEYIDLIINNKNIRVIRNDKYDNINNLVESYDISNIDNLDVTLSNNNNYVYYPGEEVVINNRLFTFGSFEGGGFITNSNVCFYPGTIIETDQEKIAIENINTDIHTINNNPITAITRTIYPSNLVCFPKHSLGYNCPDKKLIVTDNHLIFYNNTFLQAGDFAANKVKINNLYSRRHSKKIHFIENKNKILYNILLDDHDIINANNVMRETLHPDNLIAKIYKNTDNTEKNILMKYLNNTNYFENRLQKLL